MGSEFLCCERWRGREEKGARKKRCVREVEWHSTSAKRTCADGADGSRNVQGLERRAERKRVRPNALHHARDRDAGQLGAVAEGVSPDRAGLKGLDRDRLDSGVRECVCAIGERWRGRVQLCVSVYTRKHCAYAWFNVYALS